MKDYVLHIGPTFDVTNRKSFLEKDISVKMSRQVRNCVESFIELVRKSELFQDPNETILADNLNYLKEEARSTFTDTTGKFYLQKIVDEWNKELDRVLSQAILNLKTCIHVEKVYQKATLDYNTWLKNHAISKAENIAAEAQAKRDFFMEDMAVSIRQEA